MCDCEKNKEVKKDKEEKGKTKPLCKKVKFTLVVTLKFDNGKSEKLKTHFNSKPYNRFLAARIPVHLTNSNLLKITIKTNDDAIYFRECGTIDYYP